MPDAEAAAYAAYAAAAVGGSVAPRDRRRAIPWADLAIEFLKVRPRRFQSEPLMEETLVPVCTPKYFEAHEFLKKPKDLARCVLLHDAQPVAEIAPL